MDFKINRRRRREGILEYDFRERPSEDLSEKCRNIVDLFRSDSSEKVPSLLHLATIRVVVCLWSQKCVCDLIRRTWLSLQNTADGKRSETRSGNSKQVHWRKIESIVISNLYKLQLPFNVERSALNIVEPMCAQIKFWIDFHYEIFFSKFPNSFCWTSKGKIDFVKTASKLLSDTSYTKYEHFSLACTHCFENEIKLLWPHVENSSSSTSKFVDSINSSMVHYWRYLLAGDLSSMMLESGGLKTAPECGFSYAICCASEAAVKYFVDHLDRNRKSGVISLYLKHVMGFRILHGPEFFVYLFPLMNENDQVRWLHKNAYLIVQCFLHWPWLEYFVPLAKILWNSLNSTDYLKLIQDISIRIKEFPNCLSYKHVFKEFWCSSPVVFKEYTINKCINGCVLSILFLNGNETAAELIFREASVQQRTEMIFSLDGKSSCHYLITRKKWKILEMFIIKCIPSRDYYLLFQRAFLDHVLTKYARLTEDDLNNFSSFSVNIRERYFSTREK